MSDTASKKVLCPECDKEVDLSQNEGICQGCGLDVALVIEKDRYERALEKIRSRREQESNPPKDDKDKKRRRLFS
jgi:predicted amidophosphoribosyltransferase